MTVEIRALAAEDRADWEALWRSNLAHFGAGAAAVEAIPAVWARLMEAERMLGWLVRLEGRPAGLAHVVLRQHTFSPRDVAILEDLWITGFARRRGLGEAVIAHLRSEGAARGWRRIEWETDADNLAAQALYDRLAEAVAVRRYQIDLD